jgi:hypothetical protein
VVLLRQHHRDLVLRGIEDVATLARGRDHCVEEVRFGGELESIELRRANYSSYKDFLEEVRTSQLEQRLHGPIALHACGHAGGEYEFLRRRVQQTRLGILPAVEGPLDSERKEDDAVV